MSAHTDNERSEEGSCRAAPCSRWADILRAEVNGRSLDEDDQGNLCVLAEREDGTFYSIGHVTMSLVYQDPSAARAAIERIKFSPANTKDMPPAGSA